MIRREFAGSRLRCSKVSQGVNPEIGVGFGFTGLRNIVGYTVIIGDRGFGVSHRPEVPPQVSPLVVWQPGRFTVGGLTQPQRNIVVQIIGKLADVKHERVRGQTLDAKNVCVSATEPCCESSPITPNN